MKNHIEIEKPCHENWTEMTPTEQGAFCQKCQIDVIDFSDREPSEVLELLKQNQGKHLCGRFSKAQLFELNRNYHEWEDQSPQAFQSKFLLACVLVFGMTLFTGCIEDEERIKGELIENTMTTDHPVSTSLPEDTLKQSTQDDEVIEMVLGQVAINEPVISPPVPEEEHIKGKVAYYPDASETKPDVINPIDTLIDQVRIEVIPEDNETDSLIKASILTENSNGSAIQDIAEILKATKMIQSRSLQLTLYPNPVSQSSTLQIKSQDEKYIEVDLYDLSGKELAELFHGKINTGINEIAIDLTAYSSHTYILSE